jgi:hypothetical protein
LNTEGSGARTFLVEANLVTKEEELVVEATLIRRKRQLAVFAAMAVAVIAIIVGVSVGLMRR